VKLVLGHCYVDEALDAAHAQARDGNFAASMTVLRECRDDPETRMLRAEVLGTCIAGDQAAKIGRDYDDPELLLVAGHAYVAEAWALRDAGQRALRVRATLQLALAPLMAASELLPDDAVVWATLITVGRELGFSRDEQDAIWAETVSRAPFLYAAHSARLQVLSHEEKAEFAGETARSAPPGDPVTAMIAAAHFERFAALSRRLTGKMFRAVAAPIAEASAKWLQDEKPHPRSYEAHNMFAGACGFAGDRERAVTHLRGMQNLLAAKPWTMLDADPARACQRLARKFRL
jgi:hypothetical protein